MLAVIGGSGMTRLARFEVVERTHVRTPYGEPSAALSFGCFGGRSLVFLARHGDEHTIPPHQVNYRANLWALRTCAPVGIVAVAAVGGIRSDLGPGDLVTYESSREAALLHDPWFVPVDHAIVGIVDQHAYEDGGAGGRDPAPPRGGSGAE